MQRYLLGSLLLLAASGCVQNDGVAEGGAPAKLSDAEAKERLLQSKNFGNDLPTVQGDNAEIPSLDEVSAVNSLEFESVTERIQKSLPPLSLEPLKKSSIIGTVRTVDYNSSESIGWTPDQSWNTFTFWPFYIHNLTSTWGYTVPQTNNHYHLSYENSDICDFHSNTGKIGLYTKKMTWNQAKCLYEGTPECAATGLDAKNFYRYITTHYASDWIKFFVSDDGSTPKTFDLVSVKVNAADPNILSCDSEAGKIQIWVKKAATQKWLYWKALKPGTIWTFGADASDIDEIRLTSPNSRHFGADDLKVRVR
jgi:hypothetical protein